MQNWLSPESPNPKWATFGGPTTTYPTTSACEDSKNGGSGERAANFAGSKLSSVCTAHVLGISRCRISPSLQDSLGCHSLECMPDLTTTIGYASSEPSHCIPSSSSRSIWKMQVSSVLYLPSPLPLMQPSVSRHFHPPLTTCSHQPPKSHGQIPQFALSISPNTHPSPMEPSSTSVSPPRTWLSSSLWDPIQLRGEGRQSAPPTLTNPRP